MNIDMTPTVFPLKKSYLNLTTKKRQYSSISFYADTVGAPYNLLHRSKIHSLYSSDLEYLQLSDKSVKGILKDPKGNPVLYTVVSLYSSSTGNLIQRSNSGSDGKYSFRGLRSNYSYFILARDRSFKNNPTILEFTLKEETNE